jgi:hypothetical protein
MTEYPQIPKLPIETVKMALKLNKHWIPAYAGMTPVG